MLRVRGFARNALNVQEDIKERWGRHRTIRPGCYGHTERLRPRLPHSANGRQDQDDDQNVSPQIVTQRLHRIPFPIPPVFTGVSERPNLLLLF